MTGVDIGLLLLRVGFAALLVGHATQKLFGWFRGAGPAATGAVFATWGFRPGTAMAVLAGLSELAGAGSLALGLLVPAGCAVVVGTMLVAAIPNVHKGLWAHLGGCEVPVVYAGTAAVLAFTGPGRYALDHVLGLGSLAGVGWGIAAVAVGAAAAVVPLARRRAALRADARESLG
jgi:putative oxidoreductase